MKGCICGRTMRSRVVRPTHKQLTSRRGEAVSSFPFFTAWTADLPGTSRETTIGDTMPDQHEMKERHRELGEMNLSKLTVGELFAALREYQNLDHVVRTFPADGSVDAGPSKALQEA